MTTDACPQTRLFYRGNVGKEGVMTGDARCSELQSVLNGIPSIRSSTTSTGCSIDKLLH